MFRLNAPVDPLQRKLKDAADQVPFATSLALNDVAFQSRESNISQIRSLFDSPIGFTLRGVLVDKANKANQRAIIFLRDEVARYLAPHIEGEERNQKGLEVGLTARRLFSNSGLDRDTLFIPLKSYQNRHGNITRARARTILQETKRKGGRFALFLSDGEDNPFVMERTRAGWRLALIGVKPTKYKKRYDFIEVTQRTVQRTFDRAINRALDRSLPKSD